MACVNTICTDKSVVLKLNEVEIDKFCVGDKLINASSVVASNVLEGFCDGISTLIQTTDCESKLIPLVSWAEAKLGMKRESVNEQCNRIGTHNRCNPFQECCQVVVEKNENKQYLHLRGPPRDILPLCSHIYVIDGQIQEIDEQKRRGLVEGIENMLAGEEAAEGIAFACKCLNDDASVERNNLIYLGMISLKRLNIEDTERAVATLREGGIRIVVLASGDDDIQVLKTNGVNYGIFDPDDLVLTAEEFRNWNEKQKMDKVEKICILGNCLPSDKIRLIKCLQEKEQVVALVAQQTVDAPALKQADIGITFGTWSSQIARECSDISIWEIGNCFGFLVNVIERGRSFQENIRKFLQLELIITVSGSLINFTGIMLLGDAPIAAVQLFWLNFVVAFVGGLALLTARKTKALILLLHAKSSGQLMTKAMWRNIAIQAFIQTAIFATLQHKGHDILGASRGEVKSIIYNGFFMCQMFNTFVAREPEKKNVFRALFHKNRWFWVAVILFLSFQALSVVVEGVVGSSSGLSLKLWAVCLLIGPVSWLFDLAGKTAFNFHC